MKNNRSSKAEIDISRWSDEGMTAWRIQNQKIKQFSVFKLKSLINERLLLQANSTANIVIHSTDSKLMIKPHNHSQLYGKQHDESK